MCKKGYGSHARKFVPTVSPHGSLNGTFNDSIAKFFNEITKFPLTGNCIT